VHGRNSLHCGHVTCVTNGTAVGMRSAMLMSVVDHRRRGLQARETKQEKNDKDPGPRRAPRANKSPVWIQIVHISRARPSLGGRSTLSGGYSDSGPRVR